MADSTFPIGSLRAVSSEMSLFLRWREPLDLSLVLIWGLSIGEIQNTSQYFTISNYIYKQGIC